MRTTEPPAIHRRRTSLADKAIKKADKSPGSWVQIREALPLERAHAYAGSLRRRLPGYEFMARAGEVWGRRVR